jgi:hypothetical protein
VSVDVAPRIVVTVDAPLTDEAMYWLRKHLSEWRKIGGSLVIPGEGIHVAVEQADGSWVRVCHGHTTAGVDAQDADLMTASRDDLLAMWKS